ncbi:hypothetical protein BH09PSE6_BH09PSE6_23480 [soil metagenome]
MPRTRNDAHRLIEECMLAANVCAADFMQRSKHPCLYRVHGGPTPEKLLNLRAFLKTLNMTLGGGDSPTGKDYGALMEKIRPRPDAALLQTVLLRSMQQAIYSPENDGHFGLAYEAYAHFTSPIRRYPDLMTHRGIKAVLAGKQYLPDPPSAALDRPAMAPPPTDLRTPRSRSKQAQAEVMERWNQYGGICSSNERRADDASRDVQAWLKCFYMRERVGEQFSGKISGVAPFGVFVTLDELYVEGMVHVSEFGAEYFQYNEALHELRGERTGQRYRLGDTIRVQVSRVDIEARKMEFRLVKAVGASATERAPSPIDGVQVAEPPAVKRAARKKTPADIEASKRGALAKQKRQQARGTARKQSGRKAGPRR